MRLADKTNERKASTRANGEQRNQMRRDSQRIDTAGMGRGTAAGDQELHDAEGTCPG